MNGMQSRYGKAQDLFMRIKPAHDRFVGRIFTSRSDRSVEPSATSRRNITDGVASKSRDSQPRSRRGWLAFGPAVALLFVTIAGLISATFSPSGERGQYAVVAPPWYDFSQTAALVGTAGGQIIDIGRTANVVITHSDNPGYITALYRGGAWLVIDPVRLRGCLGFLSTVGVN
jgi:hypothetical protein